MGKAKWNSVRSTKTETQMRQFLGGMKQGMLDAGFIQTADTGQMDPETIEYSTTTTGALGYLVFRFDDALQATHPVFFKLEFNPSGYAASSIGAGPFTVTVGRGSDGGGGILSQFFATSGNATYASSYHSAELDLDHVAASGPGWAALLTCVSDNRISSGTSWKNPNLFIIERSRNTAGELTGDGLMVLTSGSWVSNSSVTLESVGYGELLVRAINYETGEMNTGGSPATVAGNIRGTKLGTGTSLASGSIGPVIPWDLIAPGLAPWRSCILVSIPAGDMPSGVFETTLCGKKSTFYPISPSVSHGRWGIAFDGDNISRWFGAGIRWED